MPIVPALLSALAIAVALAAGWRARRGANAAVAAAGGIYAALLGVGAAMGRGSPWVACVLFHFEAMVVAKTLALARAPRGSVSLGRGLAYLTLHPGVDVRRAFVRDPSVDRAAGRRHAGAGLLVLAGGFVVAGLGAGAGLLAAGPWVAAWTLAVALLLVLDGFGRFSAGLCRACGAQAEDAFDRPWLAADLGDFWGARWNKFVGRSLFHEVYRPWARALGPALAGLAAFLASGLLHEVLYVAPTDGPFGHYLLFFGLQGASAVLVSRLADARARHVLSWAVLLGTAPVFFADPFPRAFPLQAPLG